MKLDDKYAGILYNKVMSEVITYYIYIMSNRSRMLYVGLTRNIDEKVYQHKTGSVEGLSGRDRIATLVHVESYSDIDSATARHRQLIGWHREKKVQLIEKKNPDWLDLSGGWYN